MTGQRFPRKPFTGWKKIYLFLGLLFLLLLGSFYYLLKIGFDESLYCKRGSLEYYLLIDNVIKKFPVIRPIGEPTFHSSCGDSNKAISQAIRYYSAADGDLWPTLEEYLGKQKFIRREDLHGRGLFSTSRIYTRDKEELELNIEKKEHSLTVFAQLCLRPEAFRQGPDA